MWYPKSPWVAIRSHGLTSRDSAYPDDFEHHHVQTHKSTFDWNCTPLVLSEGTRRELHQDDPAAKTYADAASSFTPGAGGAATPAGGGPLCMPARPPSPSGLWLAFETY